jgi:5'(3')-deoxyribonucleotidase
MKSDLPVFIDFDGVIADLHTEWVRIYNEIYGDDLEVRDVTEWDIGKFVLDAARPTPEDPGVFGILNKPDLYDSVLPVPGALAGLKELSHAGIPWVIATSCGYLNMIRGKVAWLERYGVLPKASDFPADNLIIVRNKGLLRGSVLVDDYHENLSAFEGCRILLDAPYNQNATYLRAFSWCDIVSLVQALEDAEPLIRGWGLVGCQDQR